ncbi:hypothetical protein AMTRI_Chr10g226700 [Amborella trichopoda]
MSWAIRRRWCIQLTLIVVLLPFSCKSSKSQAIIALEFGQEAATPATYEQHVCIYKQDCLSSHLASMIHLFLIISIPMHRVRLVTTSSSCHHWALVTSIVNIDKIMPKKYVIVFWGYFIACLAPHVPLSISIFALIRNCHYCVLSESIF